MPKIGRNARCPCGSGLKYKRCCEKKDIVAEITERLSSLDAHEQAEILIHDCVYQSILSAVWIAFHRDVAQPPTIEEMEDFYRDVYGYDFDLSLIDEIVFPLSPEARARLIAIHGLEDEKIVDITPSSEAALPANSQPEPFPNSASPPP
jgi:hypothetical protein